MIACLTQLLMDFDGFHATQVEESDNHALFSRASSAEPWSKENKLNRNKTNKNEN